MEEIKVKMADVSTHSDKIMLLTLKPQSWSIKQTAAYFGESKYLVKQAMKQKQSYGILSKPIIPGRNKISDHTKAAVLSLYKDDEFTCLMLGIKDCVSVSRNVHQQKRLILGNLKELYVAFCDKYSELKIGFSKFCSLCPKWCVPLSSKGSHSVCVCIQHQNAILLVDAANNNNQTYKTLISKIVCNTDNKMCMLHQCEQCPGSQALQCFLLTQYNDLNEEIQFQQWKSTDRMDLITVVMTRKEWIEEVVQVLDDLTKNSFIAKCQSRYLNS